MRQRQKHHTWYISRAVSIYMRNAPLVHRGLFCRPSSTSAICSFNSKPSQHLWLLNCTLMTFPQAAICECSRCTQRDASSLAARVKTWQEEKLKSSPLSATPRADPPLLWFPQQRYKSSATPFPQNLCTNSGDALMPVKLRFMQTGSRSHCKGNFIPITLSFCSPLSFIHDSMQLTRVHEQKPS